MINYKIIIIIILLIYVFYKNCKIYTIKSYPIYNKQKLKQRKIYYVCWTGGYDSTFRICELLMRNKTVQPLYFAVKYMDNYKWSYQRKNKDNEIQTMKNIHKKLLSKYPSSKLLPTKIIKQVPKVNHVTDTYYKLYKNDIFVRPISQYECIARYSALHPNILLDLSVEKGDSAIDTKTRHIRKDYGDNCGIKLPLKGVDKLMYIFQNIRFPIIHYTKKDMLSIAKNNNFDDVLKMTWSCWFPTKNNKPCGTCDMCKHRIIK